ncbi:MAG TPA: SRPBCC domain-containing protein [Gaiellales bacterium]|nr:SRPBCC domain-containing protein [Gaiellales bacterium]
MEHDEAGVRRETLVAAPPERVWESLTGSADGGGALGDEVEIDPHPGGAVVVRDGQRELRGEVLEVEPPRRLSVRWSDGADDSIVEIELDGVAGGTHVRVVERLVEPAGLHTVVLLLPLVPAADGEPRMLAVA